jgi:Protein of unknown function (DUF2889)
MPLPPPEPRERLHARAVNFDGYIRGDGLFDIEARLTDVKDHDYTLLSGVRRAGDPVHDMLVRVTIDRTFRIHAITVKADWVPYPGGCDRIEAAYGKLVGANLVDGFRKALYDAMGGVNGCTHVTELLSYLPTAAVQTFAGLTTEDAGERKPFQLDRCHALETSSETVRRYYPKWYRGAA